MCSAAAFPLRPNTRHDVMGPNPSKTLHPTLKLPIFSASILPEFLAGLAVSCRSYGFRLIGLSVLGSSWGMWLWQILPCAIYLILNYQIERFLFWTLWRLWWTNLAFLQTDKEGGKEQWEKGRTGRERLKAIWCYLCLNSVVFYWLHWHLHFDF